MFGGRNMETYVAMCGIGGRQVSAMWLGKLKRAVYQPRVVGWGKRWEGVSKGREYMYIYG